MGNYRTKYSALTKKINLHARVDINEKNSTGTILNIAGARNM
jgi:hypothetical protein